MFTSVEIVLRGVDPGVILEFVVMSCCLVFNIFVNPTWLLPMTSHCTVADVETFSVGPPSIACRGPLHQHRANAMLSLERIRRLRFLIAMPLSV